MPDSLAPIALFTFKRPEHTHRTLESLARNPEFHSSPFYVFCDAARRDNEQGAVDDTRRVVQEWPHPNKVVVLAEKNQGLAKSIMAGVGRLCREHGQVIVVEDDLVLAPAFLGYMNRALTQYANDSRVMQVSGHMFDVALPTQDDAVFLPFTTSWGWATWARAWSAFDPEMKGFNELAGNRERRRSFDLDNSFPYFEMLKRQRLGKLDSWAIRWYLSVFMKSGVVLYPSHSLVSNEGFDGSGTHCADNGLQAAALVDFSPRKFPVQAATDKKCEASVSAHLAKTRDWQRRMFDWFNRVTT